ncbi:DNA polymerase-3 subunit epsilon [Cnuella takakiae]|uniref:DNA polymerase-3 subunit epsilon n=1 Tax=Cnuella takakiae TaxID=1302690 RepID=A0A1M5J4U4_9BACT|nr:3'-5' exonuclease [Cnuella takakiae]OLY91454.1 hypothetical protein BUE76_05705 [Cnuella takakiae]SHG35617.1 DNA polymerase-3 subunit epsilon [Cnuella takakiae]
MELSALPLPVDHDFLELSRPLIFFDLETTGVDVRNSRIIELYAVKLLPDGSRQECHHLLHPGCPIPADATKVHGITDADVADKPSFLSVAQELALFFSDADLGGFNVQGFDIPLLVAEFGRCGLQPIVEGGVHVVDVCTLFHKRFARNLTNAVKFYCGEAHANAHSARADVLATIKVLKYQLLLYDDLQPTSAGIHNHLFAGVVDSSGKFFRNDAGDIVFNFGKHKGVLALSQPEYLEWMLGADFNEDTKAVIRTLLGTIKRK